MNKAADEEHWKPKSPYQNEGVKAGVRARMATKNPLLFLAAAALDREKTSSASYSSMADELECIVGLR